MKAQLEFLQESLYGLVCELAENEHVLTFGKELFFKDDIGALRDLHDVGVLERKKVAITKRVRIAYDYISLQCLFLADWMDEVLEKTESRDSFDYDVDQIFLSLERLVSEGSGDNFGDSILCEIIGRMEPLLKKVDGERYTLLNEKRQKLAA